MQSLIWIKFEKKKFTNFPIFSTRIFRFSRDWQGNIGIPLYFHKQKNEAATDNRQFLKEG